MVHREGKSIGMSRVEVLVVIFFIVLVIGLLLPGIQKARDAHARSRCAGQLQQLVFAVHNFASANSDRLPDALTQTGTGPKNMNTHVLLLPFIENEDLYNFGTRDGTVDWDVGSN